MKFLLTEVINGTAVCTLNDSERRNIISSDLVDEIIETFAWIEADKNISAVIITGSGSSFCAGADLQDLSDARDGNGDGIKKVYQGFLTIARCKLPTIAAVNGAAVGAGMNLAVACDVRVVAKSAYFDTRFMQLGLHPGGGHTWMLQRAFGWQNSISSLLFGQKINGDAAVRTGLAWSCVKDESLLEEALNIASKASLVPRELLIKTKQTLIDTSTMEKHQEAVDYEYDVQMWSVQQSTFGKLLSRMQNKITSKD
jgi:enoyl-CoA hydratase